jgi:hypothetical protein
MTKISVYNIDENVTADDKWIGTDVNTYNRTKNFTARKLSNYFNGSQVINTGVDLLYKYFTISPSETRPTGTLSFETEIGPTVNFSAISTFLLSKTTLKGNDVVEFLNFLIGSKSLIYKSKNINLFGYYNILSINEYLLNPNFYVVNVEFIDGNGFIEEDEDYMISIVDSDKKIPVAQLSKETFNYTSNSYFILQNSITNVLQVIINSTSLHPEGYFYTFPKTVTILNELYPGDVVTIVYNYIEEFLDVPDLQRVTNVNNHITNDIILNNTIDEHGDYNVINTLNDLGTFQSYTSLVDIDYQSVYAGYEMSINEIHSTTESKEMIIAEGNIQTSYTNTGKYNAVTISAGNNSNNPSVNIERNDLIGSLKIDNITSDIVLQYPNKTAGSYTIATTADIVTTFVYNITIQSTSNITTETQGVSGGNNYSQNGRNVMINNSTTAIEVAATISDTATDFIASYTKLGTANITFTFTGTGAILVAPNGAILNGTEGSTALLTRSGSKIYLLVNNI